MVTTRTLSLIEIYSALKDGTLDPNDMRTITVKWYKHLLHMHDFLKEIESLETSVGIDTKKGVNLQEKKDWNQGIAERRAR